MTRESAYWWRWRARRAHTHTHTHTPLLRCAPRRPAPGGVLHTLVAPRPPGHSHLWQAVLAHTHQLGLGARRTACAWRGAARPNPCSGSQPATFLCVATNSQDSGSGGDARSRDQACASHLVLHSRAVRILASNAWLDALHPVNYILTKPTRGNLMFPSSGNSHIMVVGHVGEVTDLNRREEVGPSPS